MRRIAAVTWAFVMGIFCLFVASGAGAQTTTTVLASDPTWTVSDSSGAFLGFAQDICDGPGAPPPPNCTVVLGSWGATAQLGSLPGAAWIWAPGLTGDSPIGPDPEFVFSKAVVLSGAPVSGTLEVAADDFAEVLVNGTSVGQIGSVTDASAAAAATASLTPFDLTPYLRQGTNVIAVRAANGNFPCGTETYSCNPAGVVFGGSIEFQTTPTLAVDIKPGSFPNSINPRNKGVIPVAILGTAGFDVTTLNVGTIRFGATGTEAAAAHAAFQDVNHDGRIDLILQFSTQKTGIRCGQKSASISGQTVDGVAITGSDSIVTVGCK